MRCDVNVSLRDVTDHLHSTDALSPPPGPLGPRCEVKNVFGLRVLRDVLRHELTRQVKCLHAAAGAASKGSPGEARKAIVQETRGWDATRRVTYRRRRKEDAQDYRYGPQKVAYLVQYLYTLRHSCTQMVDDGVGLGTW